MKECDLIMKGGVTSGVVYPHAIRKVASEYRLRSIGGTSAGAIGAALAAAAEYRRQTNAGSTAGFEEISDVAGELATGMRDLFQPSPETAPLFMLLLAAVDQNGGGLPGVLRAMLRIFRGRIIIGTVLAVLTIGIGVWVGNWAICALGVLLSCLLTVWLIARSVKTMVAVDLPAQDFGLCSGKTEPTGNGPAFGDWIAQKIDKIAGKSGDPLTIGDLKAHKIDLATVTTDLSSARPYRLPIKTKIYWFSKAEFDRLFPADLVSYLCRVGGKRKVDPRDQEGLPDDLFHLPVGDDFPVYLVARMSLSFPGLISGVPLWRPDYLAGGQVQRCLFSDGGISSNFPIHFFDSFLPSRPTFGISLASYVPEYHGDDRVDLPARGAQSSAMQVKRIASIGDFASAILNTAKDWQDTMQSMLPGYAERIVSIRLDDQKEGGLNLTMPPAVIEQLTEYGKQAGETLVRDFDMDRHRLLRARSVFGPLEGALAEFSKVYDAEYHALLEDQGDPNSKSQSRAVFAAFGADLKSVGDKACALHAAGDKKSIRQSKVLTADAEVRLVATDDRVPASVRDGDAQ